MSQGDGTVLGRRYRLLEQIGRGGMGTVWHAHDDVLDRGVAVKEVIFPPGLSPDERTVLFTRTQREARAAARLSHPSIVTVHDVVEDDGRPWIVMEYVRAPSLQDLLDEGRRLDPHQVAEIGAQTLAGLVQAHAAGILHRDIKPSNVLLSGLPDGGGPPGHGFRAVITDFGIATMEGDSTLTQTGLVMGSPAYIAPERARGEKATRASDLWALGATLYAACEGRAPHDRSDAMASLAAVMTEEPTPPGNAGPLAPVILGLLAREPADRIAAEQAAEGLALAARGTTPHVTPPGADPQGTATPGAASHGATSQGGAPPGLPRYGGAPHGAASPRSGPPGVASYGDVSYGDVSYGDVSYGDAPHDGASHDSESPRSAPPGSGSDGGVAPGGALPGVTSSGGASYGSVPPGGGLPGSVSPGAASDGGLAPGGALPGAASRDGASSGGAPYGGVSPGSASPGTESPRSARPPAAPGGALPSGASHGGVLPAGGLPGSALPGAASDGGRAPGGASPDSNPSAGTLPAGTSRGGGSHGGALPGAVSHDAASYGSVPYGGVSHPPTDATVRGGWSGGTVPIPYADPIGGSPGPRPPRRPRTALLAGIGLLVAAAAAGVTFTLIRPGGSAEAPHPGPATHPVTRTASPAPSSLPAGYERESGPTGTSIGVPSGWRRQVVNAVSVKWTDPVTGASVQVDGTRWEDPDPAEHWRLFLQSARSMNALPGLRELRLTEPFDYRGWSTSDLEFTWQAARGLQHGYERGFTVNGRQFAIFVSGPESHWPSLLSRLDAIFAGFRP